MAEPRSDAAVEMAVHDGLSSLVWRGDLHGTGIRTANSWEDLRVGSGYITFEGNKSTMRDSADTIFAQATPPGRSAVAVIRISGAQALMCGGIWEPMFRRLAVLPSPVLSMLTVRRLMKRFFLP